MSINTGLSACGITDISQAVADEAAKDAVVIEAARVVYENVTSGYIVRQTSDQGGTARLFEIVRITNKMTPPSTGN